MGDGRVHELDRGRACRGHFFALKVAHNRLSVQPARDAVGSGVITGVSFR